MKVILLEAVPKLGKEGQVVNVKPGYARNFLFPQGMATLADKKQLEVLDRRNAKMAAQLAETKSDAEKVAEQLNGKEIKIQVKAGRESTRLFGAVTSEQIAEEIKSQLGVEVEKKQVLLVAPIKRLGNYGVEINIHREVDIEVKVNVFDPEHEEAEKKEEAEATAEVIGEELKTDDEVKAEAAAEEESDEDSE